MRRSLLAMVIGVALAACSTSSPRGGATPSGAGTTAATSAPSSGTPSPTGLPPTAGGSSATLPPLAQRYDAVELTVTDGSGATRTMCVLVADTADKQETGLMGVTSLQGYDGMLFRFDTPTDVAFYMYRTLIPLSIGFFDANGTYVSSTDMAPCSSQRASDCRLYRAKGPYQDALEVAAGALGSFGIGPGARIAVGAPCSRSL